MMNETAQLLFRCYEHLEAARAPLTEIPAASDPAFGDAVLKEIRYELEHLTRRVRNAALLHGASPEAVETVRRMNHE